MANRLCAEMLHGISGLNQCVSSSIHGFPFGGNHGGCVLEWQVLKMKATWILHQNLYVNNVTIAYIWGFIYYFILANLFWLTQREGRKMRCNSMQDKEEKNKKNTGEILKVAVV